MTDARFKQTPWSLADLLPATKGPELEQILTGLQATAKELEAQRDLLAPDMAESDFEQILSLLEKTVRGSRRLGAYAHL
ncbi:MAG: hypothetical protein PVJ26_13375, partial [Anaerolineae bacterium]